MSSSLTLKNLENTEFSITHEDGEGAVTITSSELKNSLDSVVNIKDYGAVGDGVTDDSASIQAAIDAKEISGNGGTVFFPVGTYKISTVLRIKKGLHLIGEGFGDATSASSQPTTPAVSLIAGASGMTMVLAQAETSGEHIYDFQIKGMDIKGNNVAEYGIHIVSPRYGYVDVFAERCTYVGLQIDDGNNAIAVGTHIERFIYQAGSNAATLDGNGLIILGQLTGLRATQITGTNIICTTQAGAGYGFTIGDMDAGNFASVGGTSVLFKNEAGDPYVARKNKISYCNAKEIVAQSYTRNTIELLNSEACTVSVTEPATLYYKLIDRTSGEHYETHVFKMSEDLNVNFMQGFASAGTTAIGSISPISAGGVVFNDAETGTWTMSLPDIHDWDDGEIEGIELLTTKDTLSSAAKVVLVQDVTVVAKGAVIPSSPTNSTQSVFFMDDLADSITDIRFPLSTPVTYTKGDTVIFSLTRSGLAGNDTYVGAINVLGAKINFRSYGANSAGSGPFAIPSDSIV